MQIENAGAAILAALFPLSGFRFPVPISDAGTATFLAEDRAMLFMRYIRRQIADVDNARQTTG